jgi:DNA-3-methyladenine glycosylase I
METRSSPEEALPGCAWPGRDPLYRAYHDREWGMPERDSRALWEKLILDGFQAGLAWITILRKRAAFRAAFQGFQPAIIARYTEADIARLMADPGIVRSRTKIVATIGNARAWLAMQDRGENFDDFCWGFVAGTPIINHWTRREEVPATTPLAREISAALRSRGYKFVGPVIVYAWMQAVGLVNDHLVTCPCHPAFSVAPHHG